MSLGVAWLGRTEIAFSDFIRRFERTVILTIELLAAGFAAGSSEDRRTKLATMSEHHGVVAEIANEDAIAFGALRGRTTYWC
jgi:hypothetical protein